MQETGTLFRALELGALDKTLVRLYGADRLEESKIRYAAVIAGYIKTFGSPPQALFSAPGRTELGGNHTDHQHGRVLAASINLDIIAAVAPNRSGMVRVQSEGYPMDVVDLCELAPRSEESNHSASLVRGVVARFSALGCPLQGGGFDAYTLSKVPGGSGLSSSAAFEVLVGTILNELFWQGRATPVEIAQIGQYAENVYFGKPCGLMDQAACSVGGVVAIDFADNAHPAVQQIDFDLAATGHALCILDSGAGHADLTAEYAAITDELGAVCRCFGKSVLREIPEAQFMARLPEVRRAVGDRAVLRALHIYGENERAHAQADALRTGDFTRFLALSRESGRSSSLYLQNITPAGQAAHQELMLTLALCDKLLGTRGSFRVHGGGFGGAAQAFVPLDLLEAFRREIESVLGAGSCHILTIRPAGGIKLTEGEQHG